MGNELAKFTRNELIEREYIKFNHNSLNNIDGSLNYNKIANAISFIRTLKLFLQTDEEYCLIFEDDIKIPNKNEVRNINQKLKKLFDIVDPNWQYINLGRCWDESCKSQKFNYDDLKVSHCLPVCTHSILIKRNIAFNLIHNTFPLSKSKDNVWKELIHKNNHWMRYSYCAVPSIFHQDRHKLGSNLGNNHPQLECAGSSYSIKRFFKYYNPIIIEKFTSSAKKYNKIYILIILFISLAILKFL
jgi:GR25 family glycosyltransferase involved in LPS biosynthesis